jgi:hypothetical protein
MIVLTSNIGSRAIATARGSGGISAFRQGVRPGEEEELVGQEAAAEKVGRLEGDGGGCALISRVKTVCSLVCVNVGLFWSVTWTAY